MIAFRELSDAEFPAFRAHLVEVYAEGLVHTHHHSLDEARKQAMEQFDSLLSQGHTTPNHALYQIVAPDTSVMLGYLWCMVNRAQQKAHLYGIEIMAPYRGQGHGTNALRMLEAQLKDLGIMELSLHVFTDNSGAIRLYQRLGYQATALHMQKLL